MNETTITNLLQADTTGLKISIYLPTHPASSEQTVREDAIRFKNALQAVQSSDRYDAALKNTMNSLSKLVDDMDFWKHQTMGLAVFADEHGYHTAQLHYDVTEANFIEEQYQVSPLVLAQSMGSNYYVLDINHTRPRLLAGTPSGCAELLLDDMPGSFEEITDNIEYTNQLQHQSGGVGGFHGHTDDGAIQDDTNSYYRKVAKAVDGYLVGHSEPLLLMGVENRVGSMRNFLSYARVLDAYIEGSGEAMNEREVYDHSIPIIEQCNTKRRSDLVDKLKATNPAIVAMGFDEIRAALAENRIATLLAPCFRRTADTVREGYDEIIVLQLNDDDVIDTESLVRATLAQGGEVVAVAIDSFEDEQPRALCRF